MKKCRKTLSVLLALTVMLTNLVFVGTVPAAAADTVLLNDNFDGYTTVSGGSGSTDMASNGYGTHVYNTTPGTLVTVDGDQASSWQRVSHFSTT